MNKLKAYALYMHQNVGTLKELLAYCAEKHNSKTVFAFQQRKNEITVSHIQFKSDVEAFGTYLFEQGFQICHVAVFGENSYEWILTHFTVSCGGNVIVPIDKELDADSIAELLIDSESLVLIYSNTYADIVEQLEAILPNINYINMKDIPNFVEKGKKLITRKLQVQVGHLQVEKDIHSHGFGWSVRFNQNRGCRS